jgi:hypothetical protein
MKTMIDRDGNPLEPGALYCCFLRTDEFEPARDGELVYWTGAKLVDENGDETEAEFDFLVRQTGADINPDMIDPRPLSGVELKGEKVYFNGVAFEHLTDAKRIEIAIQVAELRARKDKPL